MITLTEPVTDRRSRKVVWKARGQAASDGAGVQLNRVIGTAALPDLDPFLMLDEFRSDDPDAYVAGFPDHPHRGFETVTYMLAGRMRHRDSRGNEGLLGPGSVQWMTAARGLVHSEMPEQEDGLMQGFQLWVNLPAADKMAEPRYQDIPPDRVATFQRPGVRGRVLAGSFAGVTGPAQTGVTAPIYVDLELAPCASLQADLPAGHNAFVYVYDGEAVVGPEVEVEDASTVGRGEIAVLSQGSGFQAAATDKGARLLLIAGRPLREPVARHGPFVMNTRAELLEAFADYDAGRF